MKNFEIDYPIDPKVAAAIERRRHFEEERKKRILDDKTRQIGIDIHTLNKQVMDKKYLELQRKREDEIYDLYAMKNDEQAFHQDRQRLQANRDLTKAIDMFRLVYQTPDTRREFDLNDPKMLWKSTPPRLSDDDRRCTVSSMQRFDGEDLHHKERIQYQMNEQKKWLSAQLEEKRRILERRKEMEAMQDQIILASNRKDLDGQWRNQTFKKNANLADQEFNLYLAQLKTNRNLCRKNEELEDNYTEMLNTIHSNILSQDPKLATSALGRNKVTPDRWKGLSQEQIAEILQEQREQVVEQQKNQDKEKQWHHQWERDMLHRDQQLVLAHRQRERMLSKENRILMEENKRLAEMQRAKQAYLNHNVYRCENSNDFLSYFGKSSR